MSGYALSCKAIYAGNRSVSRRRDGVALVFVLEFVLVFATVLGLGREAIVLDSVVTLPLAFGSALVVLPSEGTASCSCCKSWLARGGDLIATSAAC